MSVYAGPLFGGILIGLGSLLAMAASGKIPGISGVTAKILRPPPGDVAWRVVFLIGLIAGAGLMLALGIGHTEFSLPGGRDLTAVGIAGLLVGFGTRVGGGCTSGHGVCGMGSAARDGLVYTLVFMAAAASVVFLWRLLGEGRTP
ncbi:MAG: YeeE/YedE thiosulfate transporter family protein [Verrucomicrobiota bacterium]